MDDAEDELEFPNEIEGNALRLDKHAPRGYRRLVITCPVHPGCKKHRGLGHNQCKALGPREPMAFLAVWARTADPDHDSKYRIERAKPSLADMKQWLDERA